MSGKVISMQERRKNKRMELEAHILLHRLDNGKPSTVVIRITDASKRGVGFQCTEKLQVNDVYECHLTLWTKEVLHTFLRVVRISETSDPYEYGAVFVGMSETDVSRIAAYQTVSENEPQE